MNPSRKSVLVVSMLDSIHTARWLSLFSDLEIDFHLFPSTPHRKIHPGLKQLIENNSDSVARYSLSRVISTGAIPIWLAGLITNLYMPAWLLTRVAKKHQVSFIHAIELNHAGYLVAAAHIQGLPDHTKIISTNWGSDIFWFQRFPKHRAKLKEIMEVSDAYSAECIRDLQLAVDLGFKGIFSEVLPNAGGFEVSEIHKSQVTTSTRKSIVIKGYESFVGRASIALAAIEQLSESVKEFDIHIYSANRKTIKLANKLKSEKGLKIHTYAKKSLKHFEVLEIFRKSRIYLGISLSDGISTSLLEAIVCGAYPIQTDTSCASEWIENNVSGSIISPNVDLVISALKRALDDDELVDKAAEINQTVAVNRLDNEQIKNKLANFYQLL